MEAPVSLSLSTPFSAATTINGGTDGGGDGTTTAPVTTTTSTTEPMIAPASSSNTSTTTTPPTGSPMVKPPTGSPISDGGDDSSGSGDLDSSSSTILPMVSDLTTPSWKIAPCCWRFSTWGPFPLVKSNWTTTTNTTITTTTTTTTTITRLTRMLMSLLVPTTKPPYSPFGNPDNPFLANKSPIYGKNKKQCNNCSNPINKPFNPVRFMMPRRIFKSTTFPTTRPNRTLAYTPSNGRSMICTI
ncbi:hypothetical protein ACA910_021315 [Epithemia clementina (nom. ined.)]